MELWHSYTDRKSEGFIKKMSLYQLVHQKFHMDWSAIKTRLHGTTILLSATCYPAFSFFNTHIKKI